MKHVKRYTVHPHQMVQLLPGQPLGTEDLPVVRAADFDRLAEQLVARDALLAELLNARPLLLYGDAWVARIKSMLAGADTTVWTITERALPQDGIRVLAARAGHVIGDCFRGRGSLVAGRMGEEGYAERQSVFCWRYSSSSEPVEEHLQPTAWRELPDAPVLAEELR